MKNIWNRLWGARLSGARRYGGLILLVVPWIAPADTATIYGSLGNFDVVNNTGRDAHGFEVVLEGLQPSDVVYSFTAQRYGAPQISATATGVTVRWQSPWDASTGRFTATTVAHAPNTPFVGTCYQWNPATYDAAGCEHFGVALTRNATAATYRWLVADPRVPAALAPVDPPLAVATPVYTVVPAPRVGDLPEVQVEIDAPEPAEAPHLFGNAQWMKVYMSQLPREVALDELVADNPMVPQDASKTEIDWAIVQDEPVTGSNGNRRQRRTRGSLLPTTRSVVRRIELYEFTGAYDPATHEALCADLTCNAPAAEEVGDFISAQMTAVNVQANAVVITKNGSGSGNVDSQDRLLSCGSKCVAAYDGGTRVTLNAKPGSNSTFNGWSGACSGTQTSCTLPVDGITEVGANFTAAAGGGGSASAATLQVKTAGGKALIAGGPINCGKVCSASVEAGSSVSLSVSPEAGFRFVNWSGGCTGTGTRCVVTVRGSVSVQANLAK